MKKKNIWKNGKVKKKVPRITKIKKNMLRETLIEKINDSEKETLKARNKKRKSRTREINNKGVSHRDVLVSDIELIIL